MQLPVRGRPAQLPEAERLVSQFDVEVKELQRGPTRKRPTPRAAGTYEKIRKELILKHGLVHKTNFEVTDYHTQSMQVPAELFKKLNELETEKPRLDTEAGPGRPC